MKKEDYAYAQRIQERLGELKVMQDKLRNAWKEIQQTKGKSESENLADLIEKLMQDHGGELVVDAFYNHFMLKFREWEQELQTQFDEI